MDFNSLALIAPILKALHDEGYTHPTPIQQQAIPIILKQQDLLGCAQTGTGKTAAFAIPILQLLYQQKKQAAGIAVLILTPTRELAIQINDSFAAYGKHTGITHTVVFGGVSQLPQVAALKQIPQVLIATPGRLLDLINQGFINLKHLQIFVLDEADRMLDMGFIHDVKRVITKLPEKRQTLFFSATMPPEIQTLANVLLYKPAKVEVTPVSSTVDVIEQSLYYVPKPDKIKLLLHLLKDTAIARVLVFTRTKHGADKVVKILHRERVTAAAIHGNKSQNARQNALNNFKNGELRVMVATDIAARGIDIDDLTHVINFELPEVPETYVHRIGRTGRAGNAGIAISFCDADEKTELRDIQKLIAKTIPVNNNHPYPLSPDAQPTPVTAKPQQKSRFNNHGHKKNSSRSNPNKNTETYKAKTGTTNRY
jgi:ATP-dependent RNA helicase RhlE